jgi:hypothetical protein
MSKILTTSTILIIFSNILLGNARICNNNPSFAIVIKTQSDLDVLTGCETINASLLINLEGESVINMNPLNQTRIITGYLAIIHSPIINNLFVFKNLKVLGQDLYQNVYSIAILYNDNLVNQSDGLCWSNLIDWSLITSHPTITLGNIQNCSGCHQQCAHCWIGENLDACQTCKYFRTGTNFTYHGSSSCVQVCPKGTININININESNCLEYQPPAFENDDFMIEQINKTTLKISWNRPTNPNGLIKEYTLYRNNTPISIIQITPLENGMDPLNMYYLDSLLTPFTYYNYSLSSRNWYGTGNKSIEKGNWTLPENPPSMTLINYTFVNHSVSKLEWSYDIESLEDVVFVFTWDQDVITDKPLQYEPGKWYMILNNLTIGTTYTVNVSVIVSFGVSSVDMYHLEFYVDGQYPIWSENQLRLITPNLPEGATELQLIYDPFMPYPGAISEIEYEIRVVDESGGVNEGNSVKIENPSNFISIMDLEPNTMYQVRARVKTEFNVGYGVFSKWNFAKTFRGSPGTPCIPQILGFNTSTNTLTLRISSINQTKYTGNITYYLEYDPEPFIIPMGIQEVFPDQLIELKVNDSMWLRTKVYSDPYWVIYSDVNRWIVINDTNIPFDNEDINKDYMDYWYSWLVFGIIILLLIIIACLVFSKCKKNKTIPTDHLPRHQQEISSFKNPLYRDVNDVNDFNNDLNNSFDNNSFENIRQQAKQSGMYPRNMMRY